MGSYCRPWPSLSSGNGANGGQGGGVETPYLYSCETNLPETRRHGLSAIPARHRNLLKLLYDCAIEGGHWTHLMVCLLSRLTLARIDIDVNLSFLYAPRHHGKPGSYTKRVPRGDCAHGLL
eukprot:SM000074S21695  [mRNA]  locus=s74:391741:393109:- [translate_table: standard]